MSIQAREYQSFAVNSLYEYFAKETGNPVIAMPTGTGKSVVIAMFLQSIFGRYPYQRIVIATHVKELIEQNYQKLMALWPGAPAGLYSAGLNKRDVSAPITFVGIASVAKQAHLFGRVDIVLIDEAHLVSPNDETMYQRFIGALRVTNPALKVIGLTATPWRLGHGKITDGNLFTDVCFDMTGVQPFNWLLSEGYLSPLIPRSTSTKLNLDAVHMRGGEFIASELQHAVDKAHITEAALRETIELASNRKKWLIFCSGVDHAVHTADMLTDMGIPCGVVHSKMSNGERDRVLAASRAGALRAIANNNVLTTGYDDPAIDLIVMLRPTASAVLWVQMLGRGTRPVFAPGFDLETTEGRLQAIAQGPKQNCLVLDFAGNTRRLGPINDPVVPRKKGEGGGEAPVKQCPACNVWNHASVRVCAYCAEPFPEPQVKIQSFASTEALVKVDIPVVETFTVDHITYNLHTKVGRPPSMRITYFCGLRAFSEWVCIEHDGYAGRKARTLWTERTTITGPLPATSQEAVQRSDQLRVPTRLDVWVNKQMPEILRVHFDMAPGQAAPSTDKPAYLDMDDDIPF